MNQNHTLLLFQIMIDFFSSGVAKAVRLGSTNLLVVDANTLIIPIDEFIVHPDYTPKKRYNDIALIRLTYKVEFNDFIWPACINTAPNNTNWLSVTAIGFGVTSLGNWTRILVFKKINKKNSCYKYVHYREFCSQWWAVEGPPWCNPQCRLPEVFSGWMFLTYYLIFIE